MTSTKNVIYILTFTQLWDDVAKRLRKEDGWEPVLFVGQDPLTLPVENSIFRDVPHYDTADARKALAPTQIPDFKKHPLDADLLHSYAETQSIVFELMTRFIPNDEKAGYDARRIYYWELIRIWEGIFDTLKPDIVAAASFPHRIFDYVAYLACERRGIPYISIERTTFPHISYASTTITDMSAPFRVEMKRIRKTQTSTVTMSDETEKYLEKLKKPYAQGKPVQLSLSGYFSARQEKDVKLAKRLLNRLPQETQNVVNLIKLTLRGQIFRPMGTLIQPIKPINSISHTQEIVTPLGIEISHMETIRTMRRTVSWYKNRIEDVDEDIPFIYFSANFQPERSTVPDAGYFHAYHLIFDILEKATPKHWNIYYKEHPHSFHRPIKRDNPRNIHFYKHLRELCPRIRFLAPTSDPFRLIDNAKAVALARGTAAWEAVGRGKPVLSFGNAWYECCPGVYKIEQVEDCIAAYRDIDGEYIQNKEEMNLFINSVENIGVDFRYYNRDLVRVRAKQGDRNGKTANFLPLEGPEHANFVAEMSAELLRGIDRHKYE